MRDRQTDRQTGRQKERETEEEKGRNRQGKRQMDDIEQNDTQQNGVSFLILCFVSDKCFSAECRGANKRKGRNNK